MDKRRQQRNEVSDLVVDVSDGNHLFTGNVVNISHSGIVIEEVSSKVNHREGPLTLNVSLNGQSYLLRAIPRWVSDNKNKKTIGMKIFSVPRNWFKFVDDLQLNTQDKAQMSG